MTKRDATSNVINQNLVSFEHKAEEDKVSGKNINDNFKSDKSLKIISDLKIDHHELQNQFETNFETRCNFGFLNYQQVLSFEEQKNLEHVVTQLLQHGKGVLALDEIEEKFQSRFEFCELSNSANNRRRYLQLLLTSSNLAKYIGGIIFYNESLEQKTEKGESFIDLLKRENIQAGVCVDLGRVPLIGSLNEFTTQGFDNLLERAQRYKELGCVFTKWRSFYRVSDTTPSILALSENATFSAKFASICQKQKLVPFIEVKIEADVNCNLTQIQKATETILAYIYKALTLHNVHLEGTIICTNFLTPGINYKQRVTSIEIANATLTSFLRTVPPAVPGIMLNAIDCSPELATNYLNVLKQIDKKNVWHLSFAFGSALETQVLAIWKGQGENVLAAQKTFELRAKANSEALKGLYIDENTVALSMTKKNLCVQNKPYY